MRGQKKDIANFIIPCKYLVHTARMRDTNTNSYNMNTQYISIKIMKSSSSDIQKKKRFGSHDWATSTPCLVDNER